MIKHILLFWLLITPIISKAQNDKLSTLINKNYFTFVDSIILKIPLEYTPKHVYDFAFSKNYIYILADSRYPILQFTKMGKFVRIIGKIGNGPGEFRVGPIKIAANKSNDNFVAIDGPMGASLYYYIPGKKLKQYTNMAYFGFVDVELFNDLPVIVCSSSSKKHIKILDKNFKVENSYIDLPEESNVLRSVRTSFWGIQRTGDAAFLSHPGYPFQIYNNKIDINSHKINSSKLSVTHDALSDFHAPPYKEELSVSAFKKYSRIRWIIGNENYLLGIFSGYNDYGKPISEAFLIQNNQLIRKWNLKLSDVIKIIPVGNQIVSYKYNNFEKSPDMTLSIWKIKEK